MASMSNNKIRTNRGRACSLSCETDTSHHLISSSMSQTPLGTPTANGYQNNVSPSSSFRPIVPHPKWTIGTPESRGFWDDLKTFRWVIVPTSSLRMLLVPIVLHLQWKYITPLFIDDPPPSPFGAMLFISHPTPSPTGNPSDARYRKGYLDLIFIAYHVVFFSFLRQSVILYLCRPFAQHFGIRKEGKLARFGEQGYAVVYFVISGLWGIHIMSQLPTWWYRTDAFWIDYPHWQMKPNLKRYYLMQAAYWCQQFVVLVLRLEKPRKDYHELVAHHFVTLWLIGWSYLINLTYIGNAVYISMDIPDVGLAFCSILNYLQLDRTKVACFVVFMGTWAYFRHYLNIIMLWSVYSEFDLMPESSKRWAPEDGVWMVWWMKWQIFTPLFLLHCLNLFWFYLILRILYRALTQPKVTDIRSDDEDEGAENDGEQEKESVTFACETGESDFATID
ncbi:longevity assurance proteins LAG1/LAC1 [Stereum hirsutum FP-91666 SS1]|uniref:longevity assurance proteins LAG1/LAC1 n=1 Tax=Stereum hirsutum (strain FP-91666) TaxID=721885 RepID=UPI000440AE5C|nr:longevity assurance proteins LAG1/LAC1 [Stereum hirsutum FP-91666 SS1]EIM88473.1 longevity assurance proteins LAG1/LAC1 [Stereum hirsutum FP-91666 SS1]